MFICLPLPAPFIPTHSEGCFFMLYENVYRFLSKTTFYLYICAPGVSISLEESSQEWEQRSYGKNPLPGNKKTLVTVLSEVVWVTAPHSSLVGKQRVPCHCETVLQRHSSRLVSLLGVHSTGRESLWCSLEWQGRVPSTQLPTASHLQELVHTALTLSTVP